MPEERAGGRPDAQLLVFTEAYPYDAALEQPFLDPQLRFLSRAFSSVLVIPSRRGGARSEVPEGVLVDEGLASLLEDRRSPPAVLAAAVGSGLMGSDLRRRPSLLLSVSAIRLLVGMTARAEITRQWFTNTLVRRRLDPSRSVAYTFWMDHTTLGVGLAKTKLPGLVLVSRANGADLFLERHQPAYLPAREFAFAALDRLFAASEHARHYAALHYPWFDRCEVAPLGVPDPGFLARPSSARRFVLASCSALVPVKRVDLIQQAVRSLAQRRPDLEVVWHHFGDGPMSPMIETAMRDSPANATMHLHGRQPNAEVMRFYREQPVDAFLNASASEGGAPVAIVEAASCGIPIIATAVGGTPEIVSDRNGRLVSPDAGPDAIADALTDLIDDPEGAAAKRIESRRMWAVGYQADVNSERFADRLLQLRADS